VQGSEDCSFACGSVMEGVVTGSSRTSLVLSDSWPWTVLSKQTATLAISLSAPSKSSSVRKPLAALPAASAPARFLAASIAVVPSGRMPGVIF
jgi:hypothetical protein